MAIDNPDHEVPPAGRGTRRFRLVTGCLFLLAIVAFLVWFVASNRERTEPGGLFGTAASAPAPALAAIGAAGRAAASRWGGNVGLTPTPR